MPAIDRRLIQNFEWPLLALALSLALIGVINLISAAPDSVDWIPETARRQFYWLGVGVVGLVGALVFDYRSLRRLAIPLYLIGVSLLIAVLIVGPIINGSQRWLVSGPVRLQPAELMKLAIILIFARIFSRPRIDSPLGLTDLIVPAVFLAIPTALVLRQPDLGTAVLLGLLAGTYLLVARIRAATLVGMLTAGIIGAGSAWFYYLHDYQKERILTFLDPDRDPLGAAYHSIQSQIAVGSGGVLGRGYLQGSQSQFGFLPEQQTDFVFSVLAEEWGFLGAGLVLVLYLGLIIRGLMIARSSKDLFGALLALGISSLFFYGAAVNVGMVLGVMPVVGVPLPMLSYGGSSLLASLIGIGLLMNVSMRRYVF